MIMKTFIRSPLLGCISLATLMLFPLLARYPTVDNRMFLPEADSWPYTNHLESIYRGNSTNTVTDGTLSEIAESYRAREERRVVEGWENERVQQREGENSEAREVRRKLPERALKILHLFFQNISPSPSPAQQTDLLTYLHTAIPGAEWFGPNNLRAWFIARRSEGTARRLLDEVVAGQSLRRSEEQQVRAQERQLVHRERSDEEDIVTCDSILYPTLSTQEISKLAVLRRNNPTPNKNAIEVWARALKADVEDVRNWVQMQVNGGGSGIISPPVVNSHSHNLPMTTNLPTNIVPQYTPIPWWPSTPPLSPTSTATPSAPPPPPSHTSPSTTPPPQSQHVHEPKATSHIPYRRHSAVPHHDLRARYRGASAPRRAINPHGRVYRPLVEVCPTTTTAATTTGEARRPLPGSIPFSLSSVRPSSSPSHHPTLEALRGRVRPRPTSSTASTPVESATATSSVTNCDDGEDSELFDPATLLPPISVPAQYRQPWSHTLPHILPPSHPHRPLRRTRTHSHPHSQPPPHPYSHLLRHILAHSQSHTPHKDLNADRDTPRRTNESPRPVVDHDLEYPSSARSTLSAVEPPSFDLGHSVFSPSPRSVIPMVDLTGPDDMDMVGKGSELLVQVPLSVSTIKDAGSFFPSASTHPMFTGPSSTYSDVEDGEGEPMDLESDDDDVPSVFELHHHHHHRLSEPKVRQNLLAELATFVHERLAYSQANGSVGLAKAEQFDFDAALGVCEAFYERIKSGVYAGVGRGLVLREVDTY